MVLLSAEASSSEMSTLQRTEAGSDDTNVVSLAFCESSLPVEDRNGKKTLGEVHTYAELKHDRSASLPDSFTVCSTIMNTGCQSYSDLTFFNTLANNNDQLMVPFLGNGIFESELYIRFLDSYSPYLTGKILSLYPNQWTKSCIAVNTT